MDDEESRAEISSAYPPINFSDIPGFSNHEPCFTEERSVMLPIFFGNGDSAVCHIIDFLSFSVNDVNILHQYSKMRAFVSTLSEDAWMWYYGLLDKSITSLENFLEFFLRGGIMVKKI